jgi:hypothetical protein
LAHSFVVSHIPYWRRFSRLLPQDRRTGRSPSCSSPRASPPRRPHALTEPCRIFIFDLAFAVGCRDAKYNFTINWFGSFLAATMTALSEITKRESSPTRMTR